MAFLSKGAAGFVLVGDGHPLVKDVTVAIKHAFVLGDFVQICENTSLQVVHGNVLGNELHGSIGCLFASNATGTYKPMLPRKQKL